MNTNVVTSPTSLSRRDFIRNTSQFAALSALGLHSSQALAEAKSEATGETLAAQLHKSLTEAQRSTICFPFDNPLRQKVDNNWHITNTPIGKLLTPEQIDLTKQIFNSLHSEEYSKEVWRQFNEDSGEGGFGSAAIALFGEPGSGKFEFVFTGRHCTRRCDGDSEKGAAFGGPIFYGHASKGFNEGPSHDGNVYWYQAKRANEVFQALDGKQREMALLSKGREEQGNDTVKLTGKTKGLPGISLSELSADQRGLVDKVIGDLLAPFRKQDATEALSLIKAGGLENLHMAFYKAQDIGNDGTWDVWQLEGPNMVWYFRGAPHVHCWAHVRAAA
jgi:Protein of unknown function (DUF3500)